MWWNIAKKVIAFIAGVLAIGWIIAIFSDSVDLTAKYHEGYEDGWNAAIEYMENKSTN